jgi:ABC-type multidrug transport system fused ATPase/permease subunit
MWSMGLCLVAKTLVLPKLRTLGEMVKGLMDTREQTREIANMLAQHVLQTAQQPYMVYSLDREDVSRLASAFHLDIDLWQNGSLGNLLEVAQDMAFDILNAEGQETQAVAEVEVKIAKPSYWQELIEDLTPGIAEPAVALVGPSGNGKTTAAEAALDSLDYNYVVIDATEFIEPSDIVGG